MDQDHFIVDLFALPTRVQECPLAGWYAEPLDVEQAQRLLNLARHTICARDRAENTASAQLQQWLARFWLGEDVTHEGQCLQALCITAHEQALLALIQGQMLVALRLHPAHVQLEQAFTRAANLLSAEDYFVVLKRHAALRALPLQVLPAAPQGLQQRLTEARVIRQLQGQDLERPATTEGAHLDTLG